VQELRPHPVLAGAGDSEDLVPHVCQNPIFMLRLAGYFLGLRKFAYQTPLPPEEVVARLAPFITDKAFADGNMVGKREFQGWITPRRFYLRILYPRATFQPVPWDGCMIFGKIVRHPEGSNLRFFMVPSLPFFAVLCAPFIFTMAWMIYSFRSERQQVHEPPYEYQFMSWPLFVGAAVIFVWLYWIMLPAGTGLARIKARLPLILADNGSFSK
jgi:hypothetical protein